jgi:Bifunctional DNA primase/polymerase, N-terminal
MSAEWDAALAYTEALRWPVFPIWPMWNGRCTCEDPDCKPDNAGKRPITKGWQRTVASVAAGRGSWAPRLGRRGIGLSCGGAGVFVLDIDQRHGADVELRALLDGEKLPETVVAATGNGWHYTFRQPEGFEVRNQDLGPNSRLHTRGVGGFVVLPPSPHRSGAAYRWLRSPFDHEIAAAPEWLLDRLRNRTRSKIVSGAGDGYLIPAGQRYTHLTRFAGLVRSCGVNEATLVQCGLAFLAHQCEPDPPMDLEEAEAKLRRMHADWTDTYAPPEER